MFSRRIASILAFSLAMLGLGLSCTLTGSSSKVKIGESTSVCLFVTPLNLTQPDGKFLQYSTTPEADKLTRLTIAESWRSEDKSYDNLTSIDYTPLMTNPIVPVMDVGVQVQSMGYASTVKGYRIQTDSGNYTLPYFTAIVTVDNGDVTGVTWDDGCLFCSNTKDSCMHNTYNYNGVIVEGSKEDEGKDCYLPDAKCISNGEVSEACPLQVYVVWAGTDSAGTYFQSSRMRFSQFRGYQLQQYRDDVQGKYSYQGYSVNV